MSGSVHEQTRPLNVSQGVLLMLAGFEVSAFRNDISPYGLWESGTTLFGAVLAHGVGVFIVTVALWWVIEENQQLFFRSENEYKKISINQAVVQYSITIISTIGIFWLWFLSQKT